MTIDAPNASLTHRMLESVGEPDAERMLFGAALLNALIPSSTTERMLVPMVLLAPELAFRYAMVAIAGVMAGAFLGYAAGYAVFMLMSLVFTEAGWWQTYVPVVQNVVRLFTPVIVPATAFSPLPFSFLAVGSGFFGVNVVLFMLLAGIGRAARYMLLVWVLWRGGARFKQWIDRNFYGLSMSISVAVLLAGTLVMYLWTRLQ